MYNLFIQLFNMSVTTGFMILAVIAVRFLSKRMPKSWHCFLWYLVMLRLILPISIESEWSLLPYSKVITEDLLYSRNPLGEVENINITEQMEASDGPITYEEKQAKYEEYIKRGWAEDLAQKEEKPQFFYAILQAFEDFVTPNAGDSVNPLQVIVYGASYIWLGGMAVMLLYIGIGYRRVAKRVQQAVLLKDNVYLCEFVDSPFVFGVVKPRIYVPYTMTGEMLECVIVHERTHIRRLDHLVRLVAFLLLTIHWFSPFVWMFYLLLCRDMELACDEMVIKQMGMDKKKLYSEALLECSTSSKKNAAYLLAFGETSVKQRVKNILNFRKPSIWLVVGTVVLCVVLVICFMTDPVDNEYSAGSVQTLNDIIGSDITATNNEFSNEQIQQQLSEHKEKTPEPKNLQEPPSLYVNDMLSSLYSEFYVQAGTYEWNYYQTEESMCGISACGAHPLEAAKHAKVLEIPYYNGVDEVLYSFHFSVMPDRMEIEEYTIQDMGNTEAKPLEEDVVEGTSLVSLKRNCIYAIRAVWDETKLQNRGFYGNAYYTVVTGEEISAETMDENNMSQSGTNTQEPYLAEVNTLEGVTMHMKNYNAAGGAVEISNESGRELIYGDWYEIQVYQDGNWCSVSLIIDNIGFHDIGYPVTDQSKSVWEINWSYFYGELPKGKYRIVKDISDIREPGDFTTYYIMTEFEIGLEHYIVG